MESWGQRLLAASPLGRGFARSEGGNVAVIFAVVLPMLVGGAGLGVETTYWYLARVNMQAAADAAAYSGAMDKRTGAAAASVIATATNTAAASGFDLATGAIEVNTPPLTGAGGALAVEVILTAQAQRFFTGMFTNSPVPLRARAVARYTNAGDACVLALNTTKSKAALFSGSTNLTLDGCSVMANSNAIDAITAQGSALISTKCLISGGGVSITAGVTMECGAPVTKASPVADPFKDLPVPTPTGACLSDAPAVLAPGRYCAGMSLKNTVSLGPGVYYVSGGDFQVNALANVSGTGVTIYLSGSSHVSINGTATVNLTAPTTGTYAGMLFFGDRAGTGNNTFNGTASSSLTGSIYFKSQAVNYLGNFTGDGGCTQIVADSVQWSGNTSVRADCTSKGMVTIPALMLVQLVE